MTLIFNLSENDLSKAQDKESDAVVMLMSEWWAEHKLQNFAKAVKQVLNPDHQYSHKEGTDEHPRFYYKDSKGNSIRYTNAPEWHSDYSKYHGQPGLHPNEPVQDTSPEYFTEDGRKLSRAPSMGAEVEWNPNYHPQDPKNFWAGRWVNPESGEHEYTYLDSDFRSNEYFKIHKQNAIVDVRLPAFRRYVWDLFRSTQLKDQVVALMLALVDQGRCRLMELCSLTPQFIQIRGDLILLGRKIIHADQRINMAVQILAGNPNPMGPLFSMPMVKEDGTYDMLKSRRVGRHMITRIIESFGFTMEALHTYHATQTYSQEMQRILYQNQGISLEDAHRLTMLEIAEEMGYDLTQEPNLAEAMIYLQSALIDPVAAACIVENAGKLSLGGGTGNGVTAQMPHPAVPYVSAELSDKTYSEQEFSKWIQTAPCHNYMPGSENGSP